MVSIIMPVRTAVLYLFYMFFLLCQVFSKWKPAPRPNYKSTTTVSVSIMVKVRFGASFETPIRPTSGVPRPPCPDACIIFIHRIRTVEFVVCDNYMITELIGLHGTAFVKRLGTPYSIT